MNTRHSIAIVVPGGIGEQDNIPVLLELIRRLAGIFDVTIYSFSNSVLHSSLVSASCTLIAAPQLFKSKLAKAIYLFWKIRKDHSAHHFVVIHGIWILVQGVLAVFSGKILRIPSIITLPGGDTTYIPSIRYGSLTNPLKKKLVAWCVHSASRIVLLTRYQHAVMQGHGISREQISIIPYGIDTARFKFQPRSFSRPVQLLYIGNLNRVKDPWTLINTFYSLSQKYECRLTVIGSDILNGEVQSYARKLGVYDKILWKGKLRYDKIPGELTSADILLLTSLYEGQAAVVLEAFASGVLVVGTTVGLLADIGDKSITAAPGDAAGLTNKIEELMNHPEILSTLQLKNRSYAETYSAEWTFNEYVKLYDELIAPRQR
jgi:glycosyltransferase involved in cell wall biosynthesis